jgi:hypothetical protein
MSELKRRIGRREAIRIALLGGLAILAGCGDETGARGGSVHRRDPARKRLLTKLRAGYPALPNPKVSPRAPRRMR